ncbi:MAG: hypothetical protein J5883_02305 [Clostridiales bacterium]|nr:hypothetical protein [Clostridiales bacterium]
MKKRFIAAFVVLCTLLNPGYLVLADEITGEEPEEIEIIEEDTEPEEEPSEEEPEEEIPVEVTEEEISDVSFEEEQFSDEDDDSGLLELHSYIVESEDGIDIDEEVFVEYIDASEVSPSNNAFSTMEEAGFYLRQCIKNRESSITFSVDASNQAIKTLYTDAAAEIIRFTGVPDEGDYNILLISKKEWSYFIYDGRYEVTLKPTYKTTLAQENELSAELDRVLEDLDLEGKSDYEKVYAIYKYICDNVTYDYDHLDDEDYKLKYTAYAALINKTAVCGGYSQLFYRMGLQAGLEVRYCTGDTDRGYHAWNIIILDGKAYYLDSTWDYGKTLSTYKWFLKGKTDFEIRHILDDDFYYYYDLYTFSDMDYGIDPDFVLDEMGTIKVEYLADNKVRFSWTRKTGTNITGYNIYLSQNGQDSYKLNYTCTTTGLTYTLKTDTKYYFKIQPYGVDGNGKTRNGDMSTYILIDLGGGWQKDTKGFWYRYSDGTYAKGWKKLDGIWYYFNTKGYMATQWQQVNGRWYYFEDSGAMITGWRKIDDKWYYFEVSGRMATGWKQISGRWYYFRTNGDMMHDDWLSYKNSWYYLGSNGRMLANTSITMNGKTYYFNSSGICTNP